MEFIALILCIPIAAYIIARLVKQRWLGFVLTASLGLIAVGFILMAAFDPSSWISAFVKPAFYIFGGIYAGAAFAIWRLARHQRS